MCGGVLRGGIWRFCERLDSLSGRTIEFMFEVCIALQCRTCRWFYACAVRLIRSLQTMFYACTPQSDSTCLRALLSLLGCSVPPSLA